MSSVNTDLLVGILCEKHPSINIRMVERLVRESVWKDFQQILEEVEEKLRFEEQKEVTPPLRPQRKHLLDFSRNW